MMLPPYAASDAFAMRDAADAAMLMRAITPSYALR